MSRPIGLRQGEGGEMGLKGVEGRGEEGRRLKSGEIKDDVIKWATFSFSE